MYFSGNDVARVADMIDMMDCVICLHCTYCSMGFYVSSAVLCAFGIMIVRYNWMIEIIYTGGSSFPTAIDLELYRSDFSDFYK